MKKKEEEERAGMKKKEEETAATKKRDEEKAAMKKKEEEKAAMKRKEEEQATAKNKKDVEMVAAKKKMTVMSATQKKGEEKKDNKTKTETTVKDNNKKDMKKIKTEAPEQESTNTSKVKGIASNILSFNKGKGFLWATADVYRKSPVEYIIFSMRDFVFYSMFMVLTGLIAFGDLDYRHNYYGNVVSEVLTNSKFITYTGRSKTFTEIYEIPEIWMFTKAVVLKVIHNAYYETYEEFEGFKTLTESILVGSPRLRQKRVKNATCRTAMLFQDVYRSCYDYYSDDIEDKSDFGNGQNLTSSAWRYTGSADDERPYSASVSKYGVGGFVMNFSSDVNLTTQWLEELEDNLWIRIGSRAVFIEFALYSPNANLFCTVKLVFEILPSGGVISSTEIITSKLWHESTWDWFIFGCKIMFCAYTIYFTLEEITQILILREGYFSNWWNILDSTILAVCYTVIITGIDHFKNVQTLNGKLHNVFNPEYSSFDKLALSLATYKLVTALLTFFVWLKLFKFAILNKTTAFLLSTFRIASWQIMAVTVMMTAVVTGFALFGTIVLDEVLQFRSVTDSFFTLFELFVGGLYFLQTNKNALTKEAKLFLAAYIIFVLVIFFSMYVAVIVNGFRKAVFELDDDRTKVYFGDVWNVLGYKLLYFWKDKEKAADALYKRETKKMVSKNFEELLEILRYRGCRGMELALLLKKHNVRPGAIIPFDAMCGLYNDFLACCQLNVEIEGHIEIIDKLERIYNTLDFLDMTLGDVWNKTNTLESRITVREEEEIKKKKKKM